MLGEILDAGSLPMAVGGTHINAYAHILALADKYGPGDVMMIHFDGHHDAYNSLYGIYIHSGSFIRVGVERGLLEGEDIVNVGLRGPSPDEADLAWMRKHKLKSHFMAEIERKGWDTVMRNILDEVKGRKNLYLFRHRCSRSRLRTGCGNAEYQRPDDGPGAADPACANNPERARFRGVY